MTHRDLLTAVWGPAYGDDTQVLRAHIANLRRKIEPAERAASSSAPTPASATGSRPDATAAARDGPLRVRESGAA